MATGREGGYHLYIDFSHLRATVPVEEWPKQGDIPGGTLKSNGFVGAPGSRHPSGRLYRVISNERSVARGSLELLRALAEFRNTRKAPSGTSEPGYVGELLRAALTAADQHEAVLALVNALEREASTEAITGAVFPLLARALPAHDRSDPWDVRGLREMLGSTQTTVTTAEEEKLLAELAVIEHNLAGEDGEDWFWNSREELVSIRQWARAQTVSPWALLGEVLAEVIARVPPTFVLPRIVAGYGSLNMLLAITGPSGAGKGGASLVAEDALFIDEPEINFMKPERIPIGSGEGLPKNYGYWKKDVGIVRNTYTSIPTCYEVDTLTAMFERGSATLSPELRKFYSGETIGHGYGDPSKRIIIPRYGYRGVFIAGVQPEQSAVIVNDTGSGFAQRWMFLDAVDSFAPDVIPLRPEPIKWALPRSLYELDHDAGKPLQVMDVCDVAADEIIEARKQAIRGKETSQSGHLLYTQEKFAAGLALFAMRTELTEEDWKLAAYAMRRSEEIRGHCKSALRKRKLIAVREEGRMDGVRYIASEDVKARTANRRVENLILKHIPATGRISIGKLANKMRQHPIDTVKATAREMSKTGSIVVEIGKYQNSPETEWYSMPQSKKRG